MPPKSKNALNSKGKRHDGVGSAGKRANDTDNESGQDEPKKPEADEGNVHKKKIKKNVDSRDAQT